MSSSELPQMAAAGGIVLCGGHALLIRKHGQWDIPKGKRKKRERVEKCALREVAGGDGTETEIAVHSTTSLPVELHQLLFQQGGEQDG